MPTKDKDDEEPTASNASEPSEPPAPKVGDRRRLLAAFKLPAWVARRDRNTPITPEEKARLIEWFDQQLKERPIPRPEDLPPDDSPIH